MGGEDKSSLVHRAAFYPVNLWRVLGVRLPKKCSVDDLLHAMYVCTLRPKNPARPGTGTNPKGPWVGKLGTFATLVTDTKMKSSKL